MSYARLKPNCGAPPPHCAFPLHRPEISALLADGDARLREIVDPGALVLGPRKTLVAMGQEQQEVYRLRSGWCARLRFLRDGRSQISAVLLPGDLIAVRSALLDQQPDEIATVTACEFDVVDQVQLRAAAAAQPSLMMRLWWQTMEDERRLGNWLIAISRGRAEERVALMLLDLRGRLALAGLIDPEAAEIPLPLTQQDLGEALGLTAVHVNRTLKSLRDSGLASVNARTAKLHVPGLFGIASPLMDVFQRRRPEFGAPAELVVFG